MFDFNKILMIVVNEILLKLIRKCLEVLGQLGYDNEINRYFIGKWFINIKFKFLVSFSGILFIIVIGVLLGLNIFIINEFYIID